MSIPAVSEDEFVALWARLGGAKAIAIELGMSERNIHARRRRIEEKRGELLRAFSQKSDTFKVPEVPGRVLIDTQDGIHIIGSDAHIWPGERTTAQRGLIQFIEELKPKAVHFNGDIFDGARISRWPRIGWDNTPTVKQELEACQAFAGQVEDAAKGAKLFWQLGNHDCLDVATECLTKRGWLRYQDIQNTDEVLSLDGAEVSWSKINEIVSGPFQGDLIRIEKTRMSMAVTPNHRVLLNRLNWRTKNYDIKEYRRADDLPYSANIPTAGQIENAGVDLPDDAISLVGWILTDGGYDKQWLPRKELLPNWAHKLNARQFQILLDALVAGGGCWAGHVPNRKSCCVIYGMETFLSSIQAVSVCHGWRSRVTVDNRGDYRLCLSKEPKIRIERPEIYREAYNGDVWCLRVPKGNFMVRRGGGAYFTGNSRFEMRLAAVAPEYEGIAGFHLKDHFPRWHPCWSAWVNDSLVVKHRYHNGIHAVYNNTLKSGKSIVTGHLHSLKATPFTDYNGTRYGIDGGTLADPWGEQMTGYMEDNPRNWVSGFVVITFHKGRMLIPELASVFDENHIQFRGHLIEV